MQRVLSIKGAMKLNKNLVVEKNNVKCKKVNNSIWNNETVGALLKSESDIKNNRTKDAVEFIEELKVKYGF